VEEGEEEEEEKRLNSLSEWKYSRELVHCMYVCVCGIITMKSSH
jgi:hypothetical protein